MSVFFGIILKTETWMQSLPDNCSSKNIPYVYKILDRIAANKGMKTLSHFVIEDPEYYQEALEAFDEMDDEQAAGSIASLQSRLEELANQPEWFSPEEAGQAAQTLQSLAEHLRNHPSLFNEYGEEANAVIADELEGFARFLNKVQSRNIWFKFYME